ncbi:acetylxylan esterase [Microbacterium sp. ZW T5_45]|uniref:acetylxylan esterase n=1 Tax=Microbacterium sp. ZW T5_45 TaxID=3378080 RepID=UPI0038545A8A
MSAEHPEELTEYPLSSLLTPLDPPVQPPDFDAFWQSTFDEFGTGSVPWRTQAELPSTPAHRALEIRFSSSAGEDAAAYVMIPHSRAAIRRGLVLGHGYGGRTGPDHDRVPSDTAAIFPCAPGTHRGASSRFPSEPSDHVLAGIAHRETYSHRFAAADIWRAVTVLLDIAPESEGALDFSGSSFGAGIGALAIPWDPRFRRASLDVPSFGHHAIRLTRRCTGSGEAVRQHVKAHPDVRPVLDWFDAATAARCLALPVHIGAALLDPAVDPRGQFAVYHALTGPRRLHVRANGHLGGATGAASDRMALRAAMDFLALPDDRLESEVTENT